MTLWSAFRSTSFAFVATLLTLTPIAAQESRATLSGTITDPSGSAIVGARLNLVNIETSTASTVETNQAGQYRFLFLNPGRYRLTAEMSGFRTYVRDAFELSTNQAGTIDVVLQLGTQAETITVGAEAPLLEAEKADRGGVVATRNLAELPIITRTPILLATLSPGVTPTNPRYDLTPFSNSGLTTWSINGSTSLSTEFLLDGAPNSAVYESKPSVAYIPPVDAVQELKVTAGAYDAQYAHNGGGVINMVIKSGTNQMHGSAYDFFKRPALNANAFSNNSKGQPRDNNSLDEYGFSFGAPVRIPKVYNGTDRTFFFVAWEHYYQNILFPQNDISSVPTVAQKNGDFSQTFDARGQLISIYDPLSGRLVNGNWVRTAFPGNKIPADRFDPVGRKLANLYPDPNLVTPGSVPWQNNFLLENNVTWYDFNNFAARLDHNFGTKERIYGRYVWNDQLLHQNSNGLPGYAADLREGHKINNGLSLDSLTILSPSTTLDIRTSITRWVQDYKPTNYGDYDATVIGWSPQLVNSLPDKRQFPTANVENYKRIGPSANNIWLAPTTTIAFAPTLTTIRGRHGLKFGLDYRWVRYANYQPINTGGIFTFDRAFTRANYLSADALSGNAIASMLLGAASSGQVDYLARPYYQWKYYAPWIQDDIKLTRRLTINLGLRWDVTSPVTEKYNRINRGFFTDQVNPISSRIDQTRFPGYKVYGGIGFAGQNGLSQSPYGTDWDNWQPRIGAAFQLTPTTVLRGGWGISYIASVSTGTSFGFSQTTPFVATEDAGRTPANLISNPFPSGIAGPTGASLGLETLLGRGPNFADPSGVLGYVHSFSFGIQKQLPGQISIDAAYVGSRTVGVPTTVGFNELSKDNLALGDRTKGGNPNYLNERVPNPFENLLPGSSINSSTVPRQQLLRPFPEFTSFTRQDIPNGKVWYNSLQVAFNKRYSHGLMITAAYTMSKNIQAMNYLNAQDPEPARSLVPWDRTHRLVLAPIYELPFGPGKPFLSTTNPVLGRVVGGWQITMNTTLQSGNPMTVPNNVFLLRDPQVPNPTWDRMFNTGFIEADGVTVRNVQPGEQPAFMIQPPFTLRTASQYFGNLRNLWGREYNVTLAKNTAIRERMNLQFRAEAFNLFNHPIFGNDPVLDVTSVNFGKILRTNGQSNFPRQIQLGLRFSL
jgi:hypothetical protein